MNLDIRIWIQDTNCEDSDLFLHGLPVYTDSSSSTEIVQKWGNNQIYSYMRPYYTLNSHFIWNGK